MGVTADSGEVRCPHCNGDDLVRTVSRFARLRSDDQRIDSLLSEADDIGSDASEDRVHELLRDAASVTGDDNLGDELVEMYDTGDDHLA